MLVLTRKIGETVYIGEGICVTLVDISGDKIRLGIQAPRDVPIYREELLASDPEERRKMLAGEAEAGK